MKIRIDKRGYARFTSPQDGESLVHRWVWQLYNGPIPEGYHIHHKNKLNGKPKNYPRCNCIANLELLTPAEHTQLHLKGTKLSSEIIAKREATRRANGNSRSVRCIETGEVFETARRADVAVHGDVGACVYGRQKTAGGFHWEFVS